jgi:tRNA (mo5U34)-methyltransferase
LKWNRLVAHLADLKGRRVLDIGSSSGYYLFRMHTAAPQLVIGLEPYLTFYFQFLALQRYVDAPRLFTLPLRLETLPVLDAYFDTVFCMGILYHQRDPHAVLGRIGRLLRAGGELVLENLILEGEGDALLSPPARYAKMNNVYTVPTVARITKWLHRAGFGRIRCVDVTSTTSAEQRRTEWMPFESLADYLDPDDSRRTVEGHPAPVRAVILAERR